MTIVWDIEDEGVQEDIPDTDLLYYKQRCLSDMQAGIDEGDMITDTKILSVDLLSMIDEIIRRREQDNA